MGLHGLGLKKLRFILVVVEMHMHIVSEVVIYYILLLRLTKIYIFKIFEATPCSLD